MTETDKPLSKDQKAFVLAYFPEAIDFKQLTASGSDRVYYRFTENETSYILTLSENIAENQSFIYFAQHFTKKKVAIPTVLAVKEDQLAYIQNDLGAVDLFAIMQEEGKTDRLKSLFRKSVENLAHMQIKGHEDFDYSHCYDFKELNETLVLHDLYYFKNYFLDLLDVPYSKSTLLTEFHQLGKEIEKMADKKFMFRDFQSRNIMIKEEEPYFIDFQGGMLGPGVYDLISLTWQAKAQLPTNWKNELKEDYYKALLSEGLNIDPKEFDRNYNHCLIIRLLQVLGAYGFRGLFQKKPHFISSISFGLLNLKTLLAFPLLEEYPELKKVVTELSEIKEEKIQQLING